MEFPVYSFLYLLDIFTIQNSSDMRGKEDSRPAVLKSVLISRRYRNEYTGNSIHVDYGIFADYCFTDTDDKI